MAKTIKVGNLIVEVPDNSPLLPPSQASAGRVAERPEAPSEPEPEAYVYQPNDPYRAAIDRVHAVGNLQKVDKPWVQNTFFVFFVVFPFTCLELAAVASAWHEEGLMKLKMFLLFSFLAVLFSLPYFIIWRRARKARAKSRHAAA